MISFRNLIDENNSKSNKQVITGRCKSVFLPFFCLFLIIKENNMFITVKRIKEIISLESIIHFEPASKRHEKEKKLKNFCK